MQKKIRSTLHSFLILTLSVIWSMAANADNPPIAIAVHGGAGTLASDWLTPEREKQYDAAINEALQAGYRELEAGRSSIDAVVATVKVLEDNPLFNAAKGAVFTSDGHNELDASIMDGRTLTAGAVAATKHIASPIELARLIMDNSVHVFMIGQGAEDFALEQGMQLVPQSYFFTQRRWDALQDKLNKRGIAGVDHDIEYGTVGAVALDKDGNLAAATSTGGMTGKLYGRVGDSPIIGAGTYANNRTVAVSGTGVGEFCIRTSAAISVSTLMEYTDASVNEAIARLVHDTIPDLDRSRQIDAGLIAVDARGNIALDFNSGTMPRGYINAHGDVYTAIYPDKE